MPRRNNSKRINKNRYVSDLKTHYVNQGKRLEEELKKEAQRREKMRNEKKEGTQI